MLDEEVDGVGYTLEELGKVLGIKISSPKTANRNRSGLGPVYENTQTPSELDKLLNPFI